jgi:hypothetical protein
MAVSFATDILPLFRPIDIEHMRDYGVALDDYAWMSDPAGGSLGNCPNNFADHAHGRGVYGYLTGDCQPRMPPDAGGRWDRTRLALYQQWMDDGFAP